MRGFCHWVSGWCVNSLEPSPLLLCSQLQEGQCRGFSLERPGAETLEGFVVHHEGRFHAYLNHCPHVGAPLDWRMPDRFLDPQRRFIQCSTHGALFEIATGHCVAGPCAGKGLTPLKLRRSGDALYLEP